MNSIVETVRLICKSPSLFVGAASLRAIRIFLQGYLFAIERTGDARPRILRFSRSFSSGRSSGFVLTERESRGATSFLSSAPDGPEAVSRFSLLFEQFLRGDPPIDPG